ncbi:SET domain protein [Aspergillus sclerotialis]|uniref:Histone-lysine N-methyltransferase SET9 n=1 Tax=Aspergillus sclerotialis TaxID=2070753 RepID=A0A3A2ZQD8_9EURO|nr:SET domain protein [Aspergillus sclerotialis]
MPPKSKSSPSPARRERLTLSKLASYDDVATDALVDRAYFWTNTRKNRTKYISMRGIHDDDVSRIILHDIIVDKNPMRAEQQLLGLSGLKKYLDKLPNDREREWFRRHLRKYIQIYLPDCPFEVTTTNRYTITNHEAAVCARKFIKKGQEIKYLSGTLVAMTREEEKDLDLSRKDFSIVMSSRRRTPSLFLGPARFANHDCNANGRLMTRGPEGMQVMATRDIYVGEEITVSYGADYFGIDNCECLCFTCEQAVRNGWAPYLGPESKANTPASTPNGDAVSVNCHLSHSSSPPLKRKLESDSETSGNSTPRKRGKFKLEGSKLKSEVSLSEIPSTVEPTDGAQQPHPLPEAECDTNNVNHKEISKDNIEPNGNGIETIEQPSVVTHSESPQSPPADPSHHSSASTAITSVCDLGIKIKTEEVARASADVSSSTTPSLEPSAVGQSEGEPRVISGDGDVLSDLSDSLELDDKLGTVIKRARGRKGSRGKPVVPSVEAESHPVRVPGDYTKTSKLLAQRYDRWVECRTCDTWFVQHNSYQIRRECPRCERHSKLYGFRWPKTDYEGPKDDEERVMDHRTVQRFLHPDELVGFSRRGRGVSVNATPSTELSDRPTETDECELGDDRGKTRATRRRTQELRMTM